MSTPAPAPAPAKGLAAFAAGSHVPLEEVRFGVILNGGVSLAVWMGGVVLELDRLTKAGTGVSDAYGTLLRLAGCTARADVIAGTSAGGINGAALALSQVNAQADLGMLRDIWIDQGRIESLLRQPFNGEPTSLLRGDEFFLPQLNDALGRLAVPMGWRDPDAAPVDLTITTTVLGGNQSVTVDSMGQPLPQSVYAGRFHWRRLPTTSEDVDPFSKTNLERTAHRLALASRSTASFPVAFEPSFVPVGSPTHATPPAGTALTDEQRLHPDMTDCVESWGDTSPRRDRSRFVMDGGALANTPTRAALEAVEAMPAKGPVRRVMLLVYPHAPAVGVDPPGTQSEPPTVTGALAGLFGALTGQGSRSYVESLEQHNRLAAGRRGTREDILASLNAPNDPNSPPDLEALSTAIFGQYRRLRQWRAGRDLAEWITGKGPGGEEGLSVLPEGWNYERVRRATERAQVTWDQRWRGSSPRAASRPGIPYVPDLPPTTAAPAQPAGWGWGVSGGLGVAEAAADLLRRLVRVLPAGREYEIAEQARETISRLTRRIDAARDLVDRAWRDSPVIAGLEPNETYWTLRLAFYDRMMIGTDRPYEVRALIRVVAAHEGRLAAVRLQSEEAGERHRATVVEELTTRLTGDDVGAPGFAGETVRGLVSEVVDAVAVALPVLSAHAQAWPELVAWRDCLAGRLPADPDVLLTRLLQLEVASTALGDEVTTGATLPVELVQISAQTANAFTRYTRTGDDKLGGMSMARFGGFLKRSWRMNDWIWGRVDAATMLCRTVLQPDRVRRTAELSGYLDTGTPKGLAQDTVEGVVRLLGSSATPDPRLTRLSAAAVEELTAVFDRTHSARDLPASMPALADLFAWAIHQELVSTELPKLAEAIRADRVEGSNARSRGEVFLQEHSPLIARVEAASRDRLAPASVDDQARVLDAFDRAGIGREPLREEASSDMTIRTAATAAAVLATVADSDRSGLKAVRPITRALRGFMLLPYWVVTGLSSQAVLARALSLLGLSVGGVLLALSLFGVLPSGLAGPAAAVGASAVLVAFAYGAMRTGTMLHGLVLLSPVIPLIAYSVETAPGRSAEHGSSTLLVVTALALGLMFLGSLGAAGGSVWASLDRLADRRGVPAVRIAPAGSVMQLLMRTWRRLRGVAQSALPLLLLAVVVTAVGWLVVELLDDWDVEAIRSHLLLLGVIALVAALVGAFAAHFGGLLLQVLKGTVTDGEEGWAFQPVAHPMGTAAGWSVLYGLGYVGVAALLLQAPASWQEMVWVRASLATAVVFAAFLLLVVPIALPLLALRTMRRHEISRARTVAPFPLPDEVDGQPSDEAVARARRQRALGLDLAARGVAYRRLVSNAEGADARVPSLTKPGARLEQLICDLRAGESLLALWPNQRDPGPADLAELRVSVERWHSHGDGRNISEPAQDRYALLVVALRSCDVDSVRTTFSTLSDELSDQRRRWIRGALRSWKPTP